jgi:hypothetical protein
MQAKRNMKKKIKHFIFIGLAAWCSFNPESPNSSSCYRELHNQAQALRQGKKEIKNRKSDFPHSQGQLLRGASTLSHTIQALVTESFTIWPKP